jgi:hypothetical protein
MAYLPNEGIHLKVFKNKFFYEISTLNAVNLTTSDPLYFELLSF